MNTTFIPLWRRTRPEDFSLRAFTLDHKDVRTEILIFDPVTGRPTHLITGVDFLYDPCCQWYIFGSAWTLIQPLETRCRAGSVLHYAARVDEMATRTENRK